MTDAAPVTLDQIDEWRSDFEADPRTRLMQNAVATTPVTQIALDRRIVTSIDPSVSHRLDDWPVTNQKKSGRCWLFAGLNLLKAHAVDELELDTFEFSQNYLHFWDKLEKANWFLTSMIELADRDQDDRTIARLLDDPIGDGGQWDMFVSLVTKYGVVPKSTMPETDSSSDTGAMNKALKTLLRRGARDLRAAVRSGGDAQALRAELVSAAYRVLAIHLGTPPSEFFWQWRDKDKNFRRKGRMTPQEFAETYIDIDLTDYVCLVNDPRATSPIGSVLTIDHLGNVVGGRPVRYLNLEADQLRDLAMRTVMDGRPVWFGCDVGQQFDRTLGIWDAHLLDYQSVYGIDLEMSKAERMVFAESAMSHAMVLTGVDVVDGVARRWRVENSWGDEKADKGFGTMNDSWFGEHVFEVAIHRDLLDDELKAALDGEPIVLPLWDPMGALA